MISTTTVRLMLCGPRLTAWYQVVLWVTNSWLQSSRLFKPKPGDPRVYGLEKLFREYGVDISFGGHTYYT